MKLIPLQDIFEVTYGNKYDFKNMIVSNTFEVAFISRISKNNGIVSFVNKLEKEPYPAGCITVNLGGAILESFVQLFPFYTAQNIAVLKPKKDMSEVEKIFYCYAIKANKFRYGAFGREANRTLKTLLVPSEVPSKFLKLKIEGNSPNSVLKKKISLSEREWSWFRYDDLFDIKKGKRLTKQMIIEGETPFVGSSELANGITAYIKSAPIHKGNTISVTYNGSVAEAFYQEKDFWASDDVNVLYPKFKLNPYIAFFLLPLIRKEKYRFNYGRKWHLERMKESMIRLPVDTAGKPDWTFMEEYIKSLPYSTNIQ